MARLLMLPPIKQEGREMERRKCLIVSQDQGFIAEMQSLIESRCREVYVATSWWEANRLGDEGFIDVVVWDPVMEAVG